jgi:hypothetical protein
LIEPTAVETSTAGTTISTEFQKNGFRPLQSAPVQAWFQAFSQAATVGACGSASRLPLRISSMSFSEVVTITYIGTRKNSAKPIKAAQTAMRLPETFTARPFDCAARCRGRARRWPRWWRA